MNDSGMKLEKSPVNEYVTTCDHCGDTGLAYELNVKYAEIFFKEAGWCVIYDKTVCPECAERIRKTWGEK